MSCYTADHWPGDKPTFLFSFGAYGDTHVLVFDQGIEAGLESAAEVLREREPGLFEEPDYVDAAKDLGLEWPAELSELTDEQREAIHDHATQDLTYTESGYLVSWEWTVADAPDAATLASLGFTVYEPVKAYVEHTQYFPGTSDPYGVGGTPREAYDDATEIVCQGAEDTSALVFLPMELDCSEDRTVDEEIGEETGEDSELYWHCILRRVGE